MASLTDRVWEGPRPERLHLSRGVYTHLVTGRQFRLTATIRPRFAAGKANRGWGEVWGLFPVFFLSLRAGRGEGVKDWGRIRIVRAWNGGFHPPYEGWKGPVNLACLASRDAKLYPTQSARRISFLHRSLG